MLSFLFTKTPLVFFAQSFWRDEAFSYLVAKRNLWDLIIITAKDFNPPLYYILVHFWMRFFGSSEISLRTISIIFYWMTLYVIFLFILNILKIRSKLSWVYLLLFAANPILLYYAFEARMYTMLAFFATASFYFFLQKNYRAFLVATILGLYTHYFMIFIVSAELFFYYAILKNKITRKNLIYYGVPFLFFLPWLFFMLRVKDVAIEQFWIEKTSAQTVTQFIGIVFTGYDSGLRFYHKAITTISLGLTWFLGIGLWYVLKQKTKRIDTKLLYYLFIWGVGIPLLVAGISFFVPLFFPRYLIFSTVGLVLLMVYILEHLPSTIRYVILTILFLITINFHAQQVKDRKKSDLRRIFKEIKYLAKPNDVVYVTNELNYFASQYYFDENRVYVYGKNYDEIPNYVGKVLMPRSRFVYTLPVYPNKAFILTSDTHYDIQAAH